MGRAVIRTQSQAAFEPLYDTDPHTGAVIEIFYADRVLARSFGASHEGWCWWRCRPGCLPDVPPIGPFFTAYGAYCDAVKGTCATGAFGKKRQRGNAGSKLTRLFR